jgi:phosphoribosyl 1,2-cyclic phosphodiesterase
MEVEFWGVRGTAPVSSPDTVKYGGATACASVRSAGGDILVVDAGTGIRALGASLVGSRRGPLKVHLLLTHFHLDHVMGFPFFGPLLEHGAEVVVHAPAPAAESERILAGLMGGRFFPIGLDGTPAVKSFREAPKATFALGAFRVATCPLRHPQGAIAYRIEEGVRSVVFATDTEHPEMGVDIGLSNFCRGADLLVYDATFTPEEYEAGKKGWGHSTWKAGTKLAAEAGVKRLLLSHLNPDHADVRVDAIQAAARAVFPASEAVRAGWKRTI